MSLWRGLARYPQQFHELAKPRGAQMAQLAAMHALDGAIEPAEETEPDRRDARENRAAISGFPGTSNQAALLEAVEEACNVRIAGNHAIGDFAAGKAFVGTTQDTQDVVLSCGEAGNLPDRDKAPGKDVGGADYLKEGRFLGRANAVLPCPAGISRILHS